METAPPKLPGVKNQFGLFHYSVVEVFLLLAFTAAVLAVFGAAIALAAGVPGFTRLPDWVRTAIWAAAGAGACCVAYGVWIEPYRIVVRRIRVTSPKLASGPLSFAHLSDIHVRRWSRVEDGILRILKDARPDAVLFTGDLTAFPGSMADAHRLLREIAEIAPLFCSRGNIEYRRRGRAGCGPGTSGKWLFNEMVPFSARGASVDIAGIDAGNERLAMAFGERLDPERFSICLYHYPDLFPLLGKLPFDLMLSGHTHGGQIRLPWLGAVISASRAGRAFAWGLFHSGRNAAFVTAGVGCRSYGLPRMRFLCPPEIALIEIHAAAKATATLDNAPAVNTPVIP